MLPDGTFWFSDLRPGTWELAVAWSGWDRGGQPIGPLARRVVEITGDDVDLGELGPD